MTETNTDRKLHRNLTVDEFAKEYAYLTAAQIRRYLHAGPDSYPKRWKDMGVKAELIAKRQYMITVGNPDKSSQPASPTSSQIAERQSQHNKRLVKYLTEFEQQLLSMLEIHPHPSFWLFDADNMQRHELFKGCLPWHIETRRWRADYEEWLGRYQTALDLLPRSYDQLPPDIVKTNLDLRTRLKGMISLGRFQGDDKCPYVEVPELPF